MSKKIDIYVPSLPLKNEDIIQFHPLIAKVTYSTCRKLNPISFRGRKNSERMVLNLESQTYEDVFQELQIEVFSATTSFIKLITENHRPDYESYLELAFYKYIKKSLVNKGAKLVSSMWRQRIGQSSHHLSGPEADVYFLGLSPTEVRNETE